MWTPNSNQNHVLPFCMEQFAVLTTLCFKQVVGNDQCPIVDTYWQTETGGHLISPLPGVWPAKPGSATLPFFGVQPAMVNEQVHTAAQSPCCNMHKKHKANKTRSKLMGIHCSRLDL